MEHNYTFEITVTASDARESNRQASALRTALLANKQLPKITRKPSDSENMDFGATLVLVLAAPAAVVLAEALRTALSNLSKSKVTITKDGRVIAERVDSSDAVKIVQAVQSND
jgi:phosphoribosylformylglycinamidine (FGAM) synthase PurS component